MAISKIDSDGIVSGGITADSLNIGQIGGRRNLIINGAMQVAQRGTSSTSGGYATVDRFKLLKDNMEELEVTQSQTTDSPSTFSNAHKMDVTTAESTVDGNDLYRLVTDLEAQDLQGLGYGTSDAKQVTLSFWVKSTQAGTYSCSLYQFDDNRIVGSTYTISSANTWEHKTVSFPADTVGVIDNNNEIGIRIHWILVAGSNYVGASNTSWAGYTSDRLADGHTVSWGLSDSDEFYLTGVQLEVGSVATPFEHRSFGEELALCQRYFQYIPSAERVPAFVGNNSVHVFTQNLLVKPMRATPSLSSSGVLSFDAYYRSGYTQSSTGLFRNSGASNWVIADASNFSGLIAQDNGALYNANISIDAEL